MTSLLQKKHNSIKLAEANIIFVFPQTAEGIRRGNSLRREWQVEQLFSNTAFTANQLVEKIDTGELGLPELQRPFIWKDARVRDLFDSMMPRRLIIWLSARGSARRKSKGWKQKMLFRTDVRKWTMSPFSLIGES